MTNHEPRLNFRTQISAGQAPIWTEEVAEIYDRFPEADPGVVTFLEERARGGPALELAIGTGRVGLPLAARGVKVDGIDNSQAMVDKLLAKPGGDQISVTIGDFADVEVPGTYRLIFLVANTLWNLLTQDNQVRCFQNVAAHLSDDGVFVVEGLYPAQWHQLQNDQYVHVEGIDLDYVALDTARHDPVKQTLEESHVILTRDGVVGLYPIVTRYVWPSELDLMARIAGLQLKERWGGWRQEPFTSNPRGNCVSVYGR